MKKNYVLDTNVLLHDPGALLAFEDNEIIIPIYVIEEIDQFKKQLSELGRNAREVSRRLDNYRLRGKLSQGVPLENGGRLRVVLDGDFLHATFDRSTPAKPGGMLKTTVDNSLLAVARRLQAEEPEVPVVLVTKDTNLRVKADAMDLTAEDFEAGRVRLSEIGAGQAEMKVSPEEMELSLIHILIGARSLRLYAAGSGTSAQPRFGEKAARTCGAGRRGGGT